MRDIRTRPLSVSADWNKSLEEYKVVSVYRRTVNLEDTDGRRCTLITEQEDFSSRTALVESLPVAEEGSFVSVAAEDAKIGYNPSLQAAGICKKWRPLILEWQSFLADDDLAALADVWDGVNWRPLVGLGPGLTPAGDDFIHGRLAAHMRLFEDDDSVVSDFRRDYRRGSTSKLAEGFYDDLLARKIWKRGRALLDALAANDAQRVLDAVKCLIDWGHSSGRAWLAGFAFGAGEVL